MKINKLFKQYEPSEYAAHHAPAHMCNVTAFAGILAECDERGVTLKEGYDPHAQYQYAISELIECDMTLEQIENAFDSAMRNVPSFYDGGQWMVNKMLELGWIVAKPRKSRKSAK